MEAEQDEHAEDPEVDEPKSILKNKKPASRKGADAASSRPASNPRPLATPCRRFKRKRSTDDCDVVVLGTGKSSELQELEEIMAQIALLEKGPSPYFTTPTCCVCENFDVYIVYWRGFLYVLSRS